MCFMYNKTMVKDFKLHYYAWIELAIWLIVLAVAVVGVKTYRYHKLKELKTYQIFMPDVYGMIVGSPVKLMGVQVGYVQTIKVVNNNVYVKFVITEKDVEIPEGSVATVEFNGLGGSKSLEITQPTKETLASKQLIVVTQPIRLFDSMNLLNEMFDKLDSIAFRSAFFVDQFTGNSPLKRVDPELLLKELNAINSTLDNINKNSQNFKEKMKERKHES